MRLSLGGGLDVNDSEGDDEQGPSIKSEKTGGKRFEDALFVEICG